VSSGFSENHIGEGTLGYKGETAEYYESKRGVWAVARWFIAAVLIATGAAFLVASASALVDTRVISVSPGDTDGTSRVVLITPEGITAEVSMPVTDAPAVGAHQVAMALPGGKLVAGDYTEQGRFTGLLLVGVGLGMILWAVWRIRKPKPAMTTVLVDPEVYRPHPPGAGLSSGK
jgi:hypothetical protein